MPAVAVYAAVVYNNFFCDCCVMKTGMLLLKQVRENIR